ncbi:MAG: N-acetyltransferase [Bacteroidales bacterium]|jgi:predicted GNAT family acetyltransferase|nr:N-acetyltransferase [Bacteroidales bacterium]
MDTFHEFKDNGAKHRYELAADGHLAILEYLISGNDIYLTHTEVPPALEGKGIGSELVGQALEDIKTKEMKIVPLCPFVAVYVKRHPEWNEFIREGFRIG